MYGNVSIYALCEPDGQTVRYVGQTIYPLRHRLNNHVANAISGKSNPVLSRWINGLQSNGQEPTIILLEECKPTNAIKVETTWIALCQEEGCDLLNAAQLAFPSQHTAKDNPNGMRPVGRPRNEAGYVYKTIGVSGTPQEITSVLDGLSARERMEGMLAALDAKAD
jgi:hypothetical protein